MTKSIDRGKILPRDWRKLVGNQDQQRMECERGPRAFGYRRCSHEDSKESGLGLDVQVQIVERYYDLLCVEHPELEWGEWYKDEAVSAFKKKFLARPGARELNIATRPGDHIIFAKFDRAFRNTQDAIEMLKHWQQRDIHIHFADLKVDLDSALGKFMFVIVAACAELEAANTSERNKAAAANLKENNRPAGRNAPLGKKYVGSKHLGNRRTVWDWDERKIMKNIVKLHDKEGLPFSQISDLVEEELAKQEGREVNPGYDSQKRKWTRDRCRRGYRREKEYQAE